MHRSPSAWTRFQRWVVATAVVALAAAGTSVWLWSAPVTAAPPGLTLTKSADLPSVSAVGQTITYTFVVTNTSSDIANGVGVNDVQTSPAGALATAPTCVSLAGPAGTCSGATADLAIGQSATFTATYVSTQADLDHGSIADSASASGTDSLDAPVTSAPQTLSIPVIVTPALSLSKSVLPTTYASAGTVLQYTFHVINTGNVTLTNLAIADTQVSAINCPAGALAPQASADCSASYTVTQADVDSGAVVNTATASAHTALGVVATSPPSTAKATANAVGGLQLTKSALTPSFNAPGQTVDYSYLVTNSGSLTITNLAIADSMTAPALDAGLGPITCPALTLSPGASTTCTGNYVTTQVDVDHGSIANTATATGSAGAAAVTSNAATATVAAQLAPSLSVQKTGSTMAVSLIGFVVTYRFDVTNTGNVTLSNVGVVDSQLPPSVALTSPPVCQSLTSPAGTCSGSATGLAPGQVATFTATYTVTQADLDNGSVADSAVASGTPPQLPSAPPPVPVSSAAGTLRIPALQFPALRVTKSTTTTSATAVGQSVTYTFVAMNTGNVTLSGVGITDIPVAPASPLQATPTCQALAAPVGTCSGATTPLAPGQQATFTATYLVTAADLDNGVITDSAQAFGTSPQIPGGPVPAVINSAPSTVSIIADQQPGLTIVKSSSTPSVSAVNDVITETFSVTNSGNVTLTGVGVTDIQSAPAGALTGLPTCASLSGPLGSCSGTTTTLAAGQSALFTATYLVTQADLDHGSVSDSATASGVPPLLPGGPTSVTSLPSTLTVPAMQRPVLSLTKTPTPGTVGNAGVVVDYAFVVRNSGNVTIGNISVNDAITSPALESGLSSVTCPVTSLAPGQTVTCAASYTVTLLDANNGSVKNTATASGASLVGTVVTSVPASAMVIVTSTPAVSLVKVAAESSFDAAGQTLHYSFDVTNTGNVTLGALNVTDTLTAPGAPANLSPISCPATALDPQASMTCTATYATSQDDLDAGSVQNSAIVTGTPPRGAAVSSAASSVTVPAVQDAALGLVKSATVSSGAGPVGVGDQIAYAFLITNTGNVTLTDATVSDAAIGPVTCPSAVLAPGDQVTCSANSAHVVTQADVDAGTVTNTATASAQVRTCPSSGGCPVTSDPSTVSVAIGQHPALALAKSGQYAGGLVSWTITLTNIGNTTLVDIIVSDPTAGPVTCPSSTLAPGATVVCHPVPQPPGAAELAAGHITNTATATANGIGSSLVTAPASATAIVSLPVGLAMTGSPLLQLSGLAAAMLLAGLAVLALGRRRRS